MPPLTPEEKTQLHPCLAPFENSNKSSDQKVLRDGEKEIDDFSHLIHDGVDNRIPENAVYVTNEEVETILKKNGRFEEKCFLWVIDERSIKIIREKTRNVKRSHKPTSVCHTNLTGGSKAYLGGEMFFGEDKKIYINNFSDRYGGEKTPAEKWEAAKRYFAKVGYTNLIDILDLLNEKQY